MSNLLERIGHMQGTTVAQRNDAARRALQLTAAEQCNPRLSKIYLTELHELPDSVKNYPEAAQRIYMASFNVNLRMSGDQSRSMKAAWKSLQNKMKQINADKKRISKEKNMPLLDWYAKRAVNGPQVQIVVP